ncbi:DUF2945 domain-containing protein [Leucobacter chromiiresistens]|uniref:Hypervirulence associated protein TUDOR domain-containing protein n=1 Tax=Leucobacter chromiiresistens TaxID=1079994 RepID=A0A1H0YZW3_9MICO|nr:DUF2945 domain-containing protein [Leucobacter chromiiresistens]SDQ20725.1 Protein of unknown function [Leucobacter chromiiresistens]
MSEPLQVGDRVSWNTPQGRTRGEVVAEKTRDFTHDGQRFTASQEAPAYLVQLEKSGATAAHQRSALRKLPHGGA